MRLIGVFQPAIVINWSSSCHCWYTARHGQGTAAAVARCLATHNNISCRDVVLVHRWQWRWVGMCLIETINNCTRLGLLGQLLNVNIHCPVNWQSWLIDTKCSCLLCVDAKQRAAAWAAVPRRLPTAVSVDTTVTMEVDVKWLYLLLKILAGRSRYYCDRGFKTTSTFV